MRKSNLSSIFKGLDELGITNAKGIMWNLSPAELITEAIKNGEGEMTSTGAIMWDTGKFTGRAPKDRYIVDDGMTHESVWWGDINRSFSVEAFDRLYDKVVKSIDHTKLYVRDAYAGADPRYRLKVRIIDTQAIHNLFCYNMFLRPEPSELENFEPDFRILAVPEFMADPEVDGTRSKNFAIINFSKRIILVGGTGYTGETKKGVFSVLNFLLPERQKVLSMHCSANIGEEGDSAIFFGLSGTGKTTLSADGDRALIGDDEHGWSDTAVFNFEGGCYAKMIRLSEEAEPEIYATTRRF
ncbi:MAG: phosphoenolpyruvate carboxykinase (ATP), partial [Bacteroidota bacterium]